MLLSIVNGVETAKEREGKLIRRREHYRIRRKGNSVPAYADCNMDHITVSDMF